MFRVREVKRGREGQTEREKRERNNKWPWEIEQKKWYILRWAPAIHKLCFMYSSHAYIRQSHTNQSGYN